ncbi:hypothetical protein POV27_16300 [Aureisphaera galaxeae]|uniref:hypothetical protein n=1 Tax=Aureisphaera galaxeae TaxID=1538023 RepID=UPI002350E29C|nr:hypothetical protein [Aureisphaera galaxeae]MDC8005622.1 hypothetical protein [Aureisphaera galaxeae]
MKIKLECHEANHICDKNQYKEATFWEKVKLNIHLIYCRACRKYTARNTKLTKAYRNPKVQTADKNALKERLQQELSK